MARPQPRPLAPGQSCACRTQSPAAGAAGALLVRNWVAEAGRAAATCSTSNTQAHEVIMAQKRVGTQEIRIGNLDRLTAGEWPAPNYTI